MFGKISKSSIADKLNLLGAGLRDFGGDSNHLAGAQQQIEAAKQKQQRQQALAQATQGLTPQQQALAQLDPSGFASRQINNQFQNPLQVQAAQRAAQQQEFQQNRQTDNDAFTQNRQTQQDQFRQDRAGVADQQFNQNFDFKQGQAETQAAQFERQFGQRQQQRADDNAFRERSFQEGRFQDDRNFGLNAGKVAASQAPDPIAAAKEQRAALTFQQKQDDRTKAGETAELQRKGVLDQITRLREGGDLAGGFGSVFGKSRANPFTLVPGSDRNDAKAALNQIVSNLTLDKISSFKGAISDKDLEIAQGAATRLQNPNISDKEARSALNELFTAFGGGAASSISGLSDAEAAELAELERQFGGQ